MKDQCPSSLCAHCMMNRRRFLSTGAKVCAGAALLSCPAGFTRADAEGKTRIRIIYALHAPRQPGPDWPNVGFDFQPHMDFLTSTLTAACPDFEFLTSMANGPEQANKILEDDNTADIDGYIVYQMNCWNKVIQTVSKLKKPILFADFQYGGSGGFLVYNADLMHNGVSNVAFVASSKPEDLIAAVKCFSQIKSPDEFAMAVAAVRTGNTPAASDLSCLPDEVKVLSVKECVDRLAESKILVLRDQNAHPAETCAGIPVQYITFAELDEAWKAADKDQASEAARNWYKNAEAVIDVTPKTLVNSAAMYLGMKAIMQRHAADAITINCLGGFYGGHIHAYPCLGFHQLDNEGMVGGCESDVSSAACKVIFKTLTGGRPGFISDPVIDTSKRQIVYAHCVSSNKVFGPQGKTNPYIIMTHSEDRQGASVRSIMPLGYMTTTIQVSSERKEIIIHQGKAVANDPDDRACRTKLCVEPVGDIEKLFTCWDHWGWHRVTCYGDLKDPVFALAEAMNYTIIEEA